MVAGTSSDDYFVKVCKNFFPNLDSAYTIKRLTDEALDTLWIDNLGEEDSEVLAKVQICIQDVQDVKIVYG
jgi:hypothetical protein